MKKITFYLISMLLSSGISAQWSVNPFENTFACGTDSAFTYPQIIPDGSGSFYVSSWESVINPSIYFKFWLQRIDPLGNRVWGDNGITISANKSRKYLTGYGLTVDSSGNAVIALEDIRANDGYSHVYLYAYNSAGQSVWDSTGLRMDTNSCQSFSPNLAVTGQGNILASWVGVYNADSDSEKTVVRVHKISPAGARLWTHPLTIVQPDSSFMFPQIYPVADDDFVLLWLRQLKPGIGMRWYTYILAQRYNSSGQPVWPQYAKVCDHGDSAYLMPERTVVTAAKDKNDGLYITWSDSRYDPLYKDIFLQYLSPDGQLRWTNNGTAVNVHKSKYDHEFPVVACDPEGQTAFVFWTEKYAFQPQYYELGMGGQKISANGETKWGDDGILYMGYSGTESYTINAVRYTPAGDVLIMTDYYYDTIIGTDTLEVDKLLVSRIDQQGATVWSSAHRPVAAYVNIKHYPMMTSYTNGMYVSVWGENRHILDYPYGGIYVQNINLNGNLGSLSVPKMKTPGMGITINPNPAAIGSWLDFHDPSCRKTTIKVINSLGKKIILREETVTPVNSQIWLDASGMSPGLYFVEISQEGKYQAFKWMISR